MGKTTNVAYVGIQGSLPLPPSTDHSSISLEKESSNERAMLTAVPVDSAKASGEASTS